MNNFISRFILNPQTFLLVVMIPALSLSLSLIDSLDPSLLTDTNLTLSSGLSSKMISLLSSSSSRSTRSLSTNEALALALAVKASAISLTSSSIDSCKSKYQKQILEILSLFPKNILHN